jgi:hypothetical protein
VDFMAREIFMERWGSINFLLLSAEHLEWNFITLILMLNLPWALRFYKLVRHN